jgi:hypothetical protein
MTGSKRELPSVPHPDHLRKQAKARLAAMRSKAPATRLAEAQSVIAREYGFASWAALQAEVAKRVESPMGQRRHVTRAHVAVLYPERFRQDALLEDEADIQTTQRFFLTGAAAQIGFLFAALVGMALLLMAPGRMHLAQAVSVLLAGLR